MEKCPRVLIVNAQSMYKKNATGITLQSIWSGWDADCLFEVYSDPVVMDQCNQRIKSYCIPPSHIIQFSRGKVAQSINSNIKAASTQQSSNNKIKSYNFQFDALPTHRDNLSRTFKTKYPPLTQRHTKQEI